MCYSTTRFVHTYFQLHFSALNFALVTDPHNEYARYSSLVKPSSFFFSAPPKTFTCVIKVLCGVQLNTSLPHGRHIAVFLRAVNLLFVALCAINDKPRRR